MSVKMEPGLRRSSDPGEAKATMTVGAKRKRLSDAPNVKMEEEAVALTTTSAATDDEEPPTFEDSWRVQSSSSRIMEEMWEAEVAQCGEEAVLRNLLSESKTTDKSQDNNDEEETETDEAEEKKDDTAAGSQGSEESETYGEPEEVDENHDEDDDDETKEKAEDDIEKEDTATSDTADLDEKDIQKIIDSWSPADRKRMEVQLNLDRKRRLLQIQYPHQYTSTAKQDRVRLEWSTTCDPADLDVTNPTEVRRWIKKLFDKRRIRLRKQCTSAYGLWSRRYRREAEDKSKIKHHIAWAAFKENNRDAFAELTREANERLVEYRAAAAEYKRPKRTLSPRNLFLKHMVQNATCAEEARPTVQYMQQRWLEVSSDPEQLALWQMRRLDDIRRYVRDLMSYQEKMRMVECMNEEADQKWKMEYVKKELSKKLRPCRMVAGSVKAAKYAARERQKEERREKHKNWHRSRMLTQAAEVLLAKRDELRSQTSSPTIPPKPKRIRSG